MFEITCDITYNLINKRSTLQEKNKTQTFRNIVQQVVLTKKSDQIDICPNQHDSTLCSSLKMLLWSEGGLLGLVISCSCDSDIYRIMKSTF